MIKDNIKYLINASNLHVGGGVQVAVSIIDEVSRLDNIPSELSVFVSDEVHYNLERLNIDVSHFFCYKVYNTYGISALWSKLGRGAYKFDVIFTIFGPFYFSINRAVHVVGFAQPWIIYQKNSLYRKLSFFSELKVRAKFFLQSIFFKRATRLVVELEHVKERLISRKLLDEKRIDVVHNCINSIYLRPEYWKPLASPILKSAFSIGFVGRDYSHKNTNCLPVIKNLLKSIYNIDVNFYVTFSDAEWAEKSEDFRTEIINAGVLEIAQCPSFYQEMDAVIFPSLLECFSATPLEAMVMKKPLFASDRGFVRDVCGDFSFYFEPENPRAAADLIANYVKNSMSCDDDRLAAACAYALNFSNAKKRAIDCLEIMCSVAKIRPN